MKPFVLTDSFKEKFYIDVIEHWLDLSVNNEYKLLFIANSRPYRVKYRRRFFKCPRIVLGEFKVFRSINLVSHNVVSFSSVPNLKIIKTFFECYYDQKLDTIFSSIAFKRVLSIFQYVLGNTNLNYQNKYLRSKHKFINYYSNVTAGYNTYFTYQPILFFNSILDRYHLRKRFPSLILSYYVINSISLKNFLEYDIMILDYLQGTRREWYVNNVAYFKPESWYTEPWYTEKQYYGFQDLKFRRWYLLRTRALKDFMYLNICSPTLYVGLYIWWLQEHFNKRCSLDPLLQLDSNNYELGAVSRASFNGSLKNTFGSASPYVLYKKFINRESRQNLFINSYNYLNILEEFDSVPTERWVLDDRAIWDDIVPAHHFRFSPGRYLPVEADDREYRWLYESWIHENINLSFLASYLEQFDKIGSTRRRYDRNWEIENQSESELSDDKDLNIKLFNWSPTRLTKNFTFYPNYRTKFGVAEAFAKEIWSNKFSISIDQVSTNYWNFYQAHWLVRKPTLVDFNSDSDSFLGGFANKEYVFFHPSYLFFNKCLLKNTLKFFLELENDFKILVQIFYDLSIIAIVNNKKIDFYKLVIWNSLLTLHYSDFNFVSMTLLELVQHIILYEANNTNSNKSWSLKDQLLFEFVSYTRFFSIVILMLRENLSKDIVY